MEGSTDPLSCFSFAIYCTTFGILVMPLTYSFVIYHPSKVVSEEKEDKPWDKTKVKKLEVNHPDVKSIITDDQMIPIKDVVVWVDPLDATQEYTGKF